MNKDAFERAVRQTLVLADQIWVLTKALEGGGDPTYNPYLSEHAEGCLTLVTWFSDGEQYHVARMEEHDSRSWDPDYLAHGTGETPEAAFQELHRSLRESASALESKLQARPS